MPVFIVSNGRSYSDRKMLLSEYAKAWPVGTEYGRAHILGIVVRVLLPADWIEQPKFVLVQSKQSAPQ